MTVRIQDRGIGTLHWTSHGNQVELLKKKLDLPTNWVIKKWTFVGEQCEKLGFITKSSQSHYASATVVMRKKDEDVNAIAS